MASVLGACLLLFLSCGLPVTNGQVFMLRGVSYANGSTVLLSDIGEGENGLNCTTTQTDCCGLNADGMVVADDRRGEFYYPDGTRVPTRGGTSSDGLFRGRGHQFIALRRLSTPTTAPPTGQYHCDIPERDGVSQNIFINIESNECMAITFVCVDGATCVNTIGSFTCTCPSGLTGDGRTGGSGCTDIDECISGTADCVARATCVNTDGSFTCTCPSGLTGDGRIQCTDNDECVTGDHNCVDGACVNTDGSFTCMCPSGFRGDGRTDGSRCTDIDECTEDPDPACDDGYNCVNTLGSFRCDDINECTSGAADCVDDATCVNTDGSFTCTCPFGLTGDGRDSGSGCTVPLQLIFRGVSYPNNSELFIGDIGENSTGSAILCTTNRSPCCSSSDPTMRFGQWYYPDGLLVPTVSVSGDFYRIRGDNQTIWLNRRNNAQTPTGSFCCELPDNSDMTNRLCVNLAPITIISSGTNTAREQFQLTCTFIGSMDSTPAFLWTGPPNDSPLPSDTRIVSDVMSSGSTHISILQFNPLQSSHEGNYTCRVVVDTDIEITSIHVNVRDPMLLTTTSEQSTMTERNASPAEGTAEGVVPILVGVIVVLLVVVILSVSAVIVMVCIFKRKHSTRNRNKDTSFNTAPNTSYGPVKSSKEMVESEYEDMKTGNEVYEEIPPPTVTFDLGTNVAYGPIQRDNDIIITSGTTLYDEVTTPAAATGESHYVI